MRFLSFRWTTGLPVRIWFQIILMMQLCIRLTMNEFSCLNIQLLHSVKIMGIKMLLKFGPYKRLTMIDSSCLKMQCCADDIPWHRYHTCETARIQSCCDWWEPFPPLGSLECWHHDIGITRCETARAQSCCKRWEPLSPRMANNSSHKIIAIELYSYSTIKTKNTIVQSWN
jgi:hypothetical protein